MQTVAIVDDHEILRAGLKSLLEAEQDIQVIGEADNGQDAIRIVNELEPDVVIMDVAMPDMNGIEATRIITERHDRARVLALSMHADRRFISEMIDAGASGYLLKECAIDELAFALRSIRKYDFYISPSVSNVILEKYLTPFEPDETLLEQTSLSGREREVLQLVADGWSTAAIADHFQLSVKTVETHRKHIMDKLNLHNVAGLTKFAIRCGLTGID